jgi:hypothetical protein
LKILKQARDIATSEELSVSNLLSSIEEHPMAINLNHKCAVSPSFSGKRNTKVSCHLHLDTAPCFFCGTSYSLGQVELTTCVDVVLLNFYPFASMLGRPLLNDFDAGFLPPTQQ